MVGLGGANNKYLADVHYYYYHLIVGKILLLSAAWKILFHDVRVLLCMGVFWSILLWSLCCSFSTGRGKCPPVCRQTSLAAGDWRTDRPEWSLAEGAAKRQKGVRQFSGVLCSQSQLTFWLTIYKSWALLFPDPTLPWLPITCSTEKWCMTLSRKDGRRVG